MENKINIAELLKDCPKGMELDCVMFENVTFEGIKHDEYPIIVKIKEPPMALSLTKTGGWNLYNSAKCVIFPKGKTTWEGFVPPCEFKDGDIVVCTNKICTFTAIFKSMRDGSSFYRYGVMYDNKFRCLVNDWSDFNDSCRLATEEEKEKLFDAIKANGYKWNPETKTLEKVIAPKFKVGDKVAKKCNMSNPVSIIRVGNQYYYLYNTDHDCEVLPIAEQDDWELVLDKFDINNLKPFDKVLVRSDNSDIWQCDFFSSYNPNCSNRFHCIGIWSSICIPYIGNEHLLGTTDDCDEYYKTW